jgi:Xaa-Pro dipeptidase
VTGADTVASGASLDIGAVQAALVEDRLDAWLLYDFRGLNPMAADVTGVARQQGHMATRRWYYLIPATGTPRALVHAIEPFTLAHLPGTTTRYAGREQLEAGLAAILGSCRRVAMEYSPECAIPYISRVDAGTVDLIRRLGAEVVSSGDLLQRFSAVWNDEVVATHVSASEKLYRIKDRAFAEAASRIGRGIPTTEYDIQQALVEWFREEGLVADAHPTVAAGENAGNPHYQPSASRSRAIRTGDLLLIDLWGKLERPGAVYADICWVGYLGRDIPVRYQEAFETIVKARDAAIALVERSVTAGETLRGWQVDRAASDVLRAQGYDDRAILHRTGHSLGEMAPHGNGVNMDDYETHDERRLLPGSGFTIEPGLYFDDFGVRTEINMIVFADDARVTGARQSALLTLA